MCVRVCVDIDIRVYLCLSVFMPFLSGSQSCPATSFAESLTRNGGRGGGMPRTCLSSRGDCQDTPVPHSQESPPPTTRPPMQALPQSLFTLTLDTTLTDLDGLSVEKQQLGRKRKENHYLLWQEERGGKFKAGRVQNPQFKATLLKESQLPPSQRLQGGEVPILQRGIVIKDHGSGH